MVVLARKRKPKSEGQRKPVGKCLKCLAVVPLTTEGMLANHTRMTGMRCGGGGKPPGPPPPSFGICPMCFVKVREDKDGLISRHSSDKSPCSGSGKLPHTGPPHGQCAVCYTFHQLRRSDGRLSSHRAHGKPCDGAGRSPVGGRDSTRIKGSGVRIALQGGLPGSGK